MTQIVKKIAGGVVAFLPLLALAQFQVDDLGSGFGAIIAIINKYIIPLAIGLAVVYFIWGLIQYATAGADDAAKKAGRDHIIYGIIAIFVMVSVWGLVNVLANTFGLNNTPPTDLPEVPGTR